MQSITANSNKINANMMSIGNNSNAIATAASNAINSDQLAMMVSTINASLAANSAKIGVNMMGIATNSNSIGTSSSNIA